MNQKQLNELDQHITGHGGEDSVTEGYTGEELYGIYRRAHAQQGCEVDHWVDLEEGERVAWRVLATSIMP